VLCYASSDVKGTRRTFNPVPSAPTDEMVIERRLAGIVTGFPVVGMSIQSCSQKSALVCKMVLIGYLTSNSWSGP
jgi:hypothetical protein